MDVRVGLCFDIGHQLRDSKDPSGHAEVCRPHPRHPIKNVTEATKKGRGIELPRGKIDLVAFVRACARSEI